MSHFDILNDCKVVDVLDYLSGTAARTGAAIDTDGYEGCAIIVKFAAIAASAVTEIYASESDESDLDPKADLAGSSQSVAVADADEVFVIDIKRPKKRYLALEISKNDANASAESAVAILYGAQKKPTGATAQADVSGESFVSPIAGTR